MPFRPDPRSLSEALAEIERLRNALSKARPFVSTLGTSGRDLREHVDAIKFECDALVPDWYDRLNPHLKEVFPKPPTGLPAIVHHRDSQWISAVQRAMEGMASSVIVNNAQSGDLRELMGLDRPVEPGCKRCGGTGWAPGSYSGGKHPFNQACFACKGSGGKPGERELPPELYHLLEPDPEKKNG